MFLSPVNTFIGFCASILQFCSILSIFFVLSGNSERFLICFFPLCFHFPPLQPTSVLLHFNYSCPSKLPHKIFYIWHYWFCSIGHDRCSVNITPLFRRCLVLFNPLQAYSMPAQEKVLNVRFAFWVSVREHPVQLVGVFKEHFMLCGEYMVLVGD